MPGKFKNAMRIAGKTMDAMYDRNRKIDEMNRELMRRAYGVDPVEARKIAAVLVDRAEVTWK
jgi:hypothetical protein